MKKILVCGGRDYEDYTSMMRVLMQLWKDEGDYIIIHGCARGADNNADHYAIAHAVPTIRFPANWDKHGKRAGAIRNIEMLKRGKPDIVVAFPGGRGTAHMIKIAQEAGVEVRIVEGLPEVYSVQPVQPVVGL